MRLRSKGIDLLPIEVSSRIFALAASRVALSGYSTQLKIGVSSSFGLHVCEGSMFYKREGLINTTWAPLFKLDPLNESAHCVVCESCGYAHWFATRPGVGPGGYLRYEFGSDSDPIGAPR